MDVAAVVVAICALVFTLVSFWWLHARRGRLVMHAPTAYAGAFTREQARLRLPVTIYNTGPVPLVIESMELHIHEAAQSWPWVTTRRTLRPEPQDVLDFIAVAVVGGRSVLQLFLEFGENHGTWRPDPLSTQRFTVRAKESRRGWIDLVEFDLQMPSAAAIGKYVAHQATDHEC